MPNYKSTLYAFMALVPLLQWSLPLALAGSIVAVQPLNFGNIIAAPKDIIEIDASGGSAVPRVYRDGRSLVTDGHSGQICVQCGGKGEIITLLFPDRITDNVSKTLYVDGFASRSTPTPIVCEGTETIDLHIGGLLHLQTNRPDQTYKFEGSITVNFDGPEQKKKNNNE